MREPNAQELGRAVAEHITPILYALEMCALSMEQAGRDEEATYYRSLAELLSDAGGSEPELDQVE